MHCNTANITARCLPYVVRVVLEYMILFIGVFLLVCLVTLHHSHVTRTGTPAEQHSSCLPPLTFEGSLNQTVHVYRIQVNESAAGTGTPSLSQPYKPSRHVLQLSAMDLWSQPPTYHYSLDKGLFILKPELVVGHGFTFQNVTLFLGHEECFGGPMQQFILRHLVGYDTVLLNALTRSRGQGYIVNLLTGSLLTVHPPPKSLGFILDILYKCRLLATVCFLFLAITGLVAFTLSQTQTRMLTFTTQLRKRLADRQPLSSLVWRHIIETIAFVPGVVGILFFLFEFFNDQFLSFMIIATAWLCEFYAIMSVRTRISMHFFPKVYGCYLLLFGLYFFTHSTGFHHLAFATTFVFIQHAMFFFWSRWEIPSVTSGVIHQHYPRMFDTPPEAHME